MNVVASVKFGRFVLKSTKCFRAKPILPETMPSNIQGARGTYLQRTISMNSPRLLCDKYREVHERTEGDTLELEASYRKPDDNFVDVANPHGACPICSRNLKITYKDVLIISQFVDKEGALLPREVTGVCAKQQLHLRECVERALAADLLPDHRPSHLTRPPEKEKGKAAFHRF